MIPKMTMKDFYEKIGGDYNDVAERFGGETMVERFGKKFLGDPSFSQLDAAFATGRCDEAFRAAHTLKGVCRNLGYGDLGNVSADMTELLRAGNFDDGKAMYDAVKVEYDKVVRLLKECFECD